MFQAKRVPDFMNNGGQTVRVINIDMHFSSRGVRTTQRLCVKNMSYPVCLDKKINMTRLTVKLINLNKLNIDHLFIFQQRQFNQLAHFLHVLIGYSNTGKYATHLQ